MITRFFKKLFGRPAEPDKTHPLDGSVRVAEERSAPVLTPAVTAPVITATVVEPVATPAPVVDNSPFPFPTSPKEPTTEKKRGRPKASAPATMKPVKQKEQTARTTKAKTPSKKNKK